jgi:hypothetical protein
VGLSAGSNSISTASDVAISALANNHGLVYDSASGKWRNSAVNRPATAYVVSWSGSAWQYKGATITARPTGMLTGDIIQFVGNPSGAMPTWAAANDIWT